MSQITVPQLAEKVALIHAHLSTIRNEIQAVENNPDQRLSLLLRLQERTTIDQQDRYVLDQLISDLIGADGAQLEPEQFRVIRFYTDRVHHHLLDIRREVDMLLPWLLPLSRPPALFSQPELEPAIGQAWQALREALPAAPSLDEIETICQTARQRLADLQPLLLGADHAAAWQWGEDLLAGLQSAQEQTRYLLDLVKQLADKAETYFETMDFRFLYDPQRHVFHIGYNLEADRLDNNYYDLLASEARIASLVAIAKNDVPQKHWLHLGRPLTKIDGRQTLLSWSGTMFEYLMPSLVLRHYPETLLYTSMRTAVEYQIAYGRQKKTPWGISESGYYAFDAHQNYQYQAFGAPALGYKRGLASDLVITPYASLLALPFQPQAVMENIAHLEEHGMLDCYGFYEALDFTPDHLGLGQGQARVRSYMAHHQGMIMVALFNYLHTDNMVTRFHADPRICSVELLLQERISQSVPLEYPVNEEAQDLQTTQPALAITPWPVAIDTPMPQVHFLSNGNYDLLITNAGTGYSHWQDRSLTRWRPDTTLDDWGCWLYLQDEAGGPLWSATHQPTAVWSDHHEVTFHPHMVEFRRRDRDITLHLTVTVDPNYDAEVRRITLTNNGAQPRHLNLTTYGEVVLAPQATDERHPAFAKLFVESEYLPEYNAPSL